METFISFLMKQCFGPLYRHKYRIKTQMHRFHWNLVLVRQTIQLTYRIKLDCSVELEVGGRKLSCWAFLTRNYTMILVKIQRKSDILTQTHLNNIGIIRPDNYSRNEYNRGPSEPCKTYPYRQRSHGRFTHSIYTYFETSSICVFKCQNTFRNFWYI